MIEVMSMETAKSVMPPDDEPGDDALIERIRRGDLEQADRLIMRHQPMLMRYLKRICGRDQIAEEIHQHAWLKVIENIGKFDGGGKSGGFKPWLFRIATNLVNDHWRSRGRENNARAGMRMMAELDAPAADYRLMMGEEEEKLRWAISRLPEAQRQVLTLRYYGNLKFVEIAQLLGCPLNTALGRMHKAMLKLRELMENPRPT
jgi:RNA polymerase sigma-70 factor, ECF subfamily